MNIVNQHEALLADIDSYRPARGQVGLWWLGQHSFILKTAGAVVYIDPFLTPMSGRRVPPLLSASGITHATIIAGTHDHADHIDRPAWPALAKASPQALFVVPELLRERLSDELDLPIERLVGLDDGLSTQVGSVRISAVPAAHELLDRDPVSGRYPYLGYLFQCDGTTVYHAGDTCWYEGMLERLRQFEIDVMLLPINGRDAERLKRNCIGNMTFQEAVDLAGTLRPRFAVPTHWDMFEGNLGDPQAFVEYMKVKYPAVGTRVMAYGERWEVGGGSEPAVRA